MQQKQYIGMTFNLIGKNDEQLKKGEVAVFMSIKKYAPNAFPSMRTLSQETGYCRNTLLKHIRSLEIKGILRRILRSGTTNFFVISKRFLTNNEIKSLKKGFDKFVTKSRHYVRDLVANPLTKIGKGPLPEIVNQTNKDINLTNNETIFFKFKENGLVDGQILASVIV